MSMTIETFCGGVPTVRETVRVTLWRKGSLLGDLGTYIDGVNWVLRGNTRVSVLEKQSMV